VFFLGESGFGGFFGGVFCGALLGVEGEGGGCCCEGVCGGEKRMSVCVAVRGKGGWDMGERTLRVDACGHIGVVLLEPGLAFLHCAAEFAVLHPLVASASRIFYPLSNRSSCMSISARYSRWVVGLYLRRKRADCARHQFMEG
jgi:hypothetical protein